VSVVYVCAVCSCVVRVFLFCYEGVCVRVCYGILDTETALYVVCYLCEGWVVVVSDVSFPVSDHLVEFSCYKCGEHHCYHVDSCVGLC